MSRPQRTRVYLGCEGESEQSYGKRLNQIADEAGLFLHLDCDVLQPGGGNPLAIVQLATRRIHVRTRNRPPYEHRAILLDGDTLALNREWLPKATALAQQHRIEIVWQNPCHESFLLHHLQGQEAVRPQTAELALRSLKRIWPEYHKNMTAAGLALRIDSEAVLRAAQTEAGLHKLLIDLGFPLSSEGV